VAPRRSKAIGADGDDRPGFSEAKELDVTIGLRRKSGAADSGLS